MKSRHLLAASLLQHARYDLDFGVDAGQEGEIQKFASPQ
jgi:hypothetical protein